VTRRFSSQNRANISTIRPSLAGFSHGIVPAMMSFSAGSPIVAVCGTRPEAAGAAVRLRRSGFDMHRITIVENDYPSREAAAEIKHWPVLASAWVTAGCLNAIGAGLDSLGIPQDEVQRCRSALNARRILVVVRGTPEEVARARQACRGARHRARAAAAARRLGSGGGCAPSRGVAR
jgi:hypothetical protein